MGFVTQVFMFEFVLIGLLSLYGLSTGVLDIQPTLLAITGPWPTVGTANCTFSAAGPTGSCMVLDTALLGTIWVFTCLGSIFYRIGATGFLLYQLVTVLGSVTGIPLLGHVFLGFQFLLAIFGLGVVTRSHPDL